MKKQLSKATIAAASLLTATAAVASESADTGATEMNAGFGTVAILVGGVAVMGIAIWLGLKVMNRNK